MDDELDKNPVYILYSGNLEGCLRRDKKNASRVLEGRRHRERVVPIRVAPLDQFRYGLKPLGDEGKERQNINKAESEKIKMASIGTGWNGCKPGDDRP